MNMRPSNGLTVQIGFVTTPETLAQIDELAQKERRTRAAVIRMIIEDYLKAHPLPVKTNMVPAMG